MAFLVGTFMMLAGSLVVWLFLDVKHEELATDGPEARARRLSTHTSTTARLERAGPCRRGSRHGSGAEVGGGLAREHQRLARPGRGGPGQAAGRRDHEPVGRVRGRACRAVAAPSR